MKFRKILAKYYIKWHHDATASIAYCHSQGNYAGAEAYATAAIEYKELIDKHREAIEFFSIGDNAMKSDKDLPLKFRGYK